MGVDGRLLTLQLQELTTGLADDLDWVIRDYLAEGFREPEMIQLKAAELATLTQAELIDHAACARVLGLAGGDGLDSSVSPRGYRILSRVPRLPGAVFDRLVDHFGTLQRLLAASGDELMSVDGVGEGRARLVREGLTRLAESSILERYV